MKDFLHILESLDVEYRKDPRQINGKTKRILSEKCGQVILRN